MAWAILDTNVYIEHWEGSLGEDALLEIRRLFVIRHSTVVLSELRRGARTAAQRKLVETLARRAKLKWTPTEEDWWEAGLLVLAIGDDRGWDRHKRREFQNDALIALTARRHGAAVCDVQRRRLPTPGGARRLSARDPSLGVDSAACLAPAPRPRRSAPPARSVAAARTPRRGPGCCCSRRR